MIPSKAEEPATSTLYIKRARPSSDFYVLVADEDVTGPSDSQTISSQTTTNPSPSTETQSTSSSVTITDQITKPKPRNTLHGWMNPIIEEFLIIGSDFMSS